MSTQIMTRDEFFRLPEAARAQFIAQGGRLSGACGKAANTTAEQFKAQQASRIKMSLQSFLRMPHGERVAFIASGGKIDSNHSDDPPAPMASVPRIEAINCSAPKAQGPEVTANRRAAFHIYAKAHFDRTGELLRESEFAFDPDEVRQLHSRREFRSSIASAFARRI